MVPTLKCAEKRHDLRIVYAQEVEDETEENRKTWLIILESTDNPVHKCKLIRYTCYSGSPFTWKNSLTLKWKSCNRIPTSVESLAADTKPLQLETHASNISPSVGSLPRCSLYEMISNSFFEAFAKWLMLTGLLACSITLKVFLANAANSAGC